MSRKKGFKYSSARNQKISDSLKGHKVSQETKLKISVSCIGKNRSKGYKISQETKLKISNSRKGKKLSEEHKQHIRDGWEPSNKRLKSINGIYNGIPYESSFELKFMQLLDEYKIPYERADNKKFRVKYTFEGNEHYYYPDFYLPREKSIVEIKPHFRLKESKIQAKLKAANKQYGDNFFVVTEQELPELYFT